MITDRAEVVDEYHEINIRSISNSFKLPKILRLHKRFKGRKDVKFNRENVFIRDNYICQYCLKKFSVGQLTLDHVIPRCRGGKHNWDNVVSSCHQCNNRKGSKPLNKSGFNLTRDPRRPHWSPIYTVKISKDDPDEWNYWISPFRRKKSA